MKQPRLYALDAMRGICALSLMLYHYNMWNGTDHFQIGYFGVYVFFMLSGFSLWYVYAGKLLDIALLREFFVARVARILPLYAVVALLGAGARVYAQSASAVNVDFFHRLALNMTLLFGLSLPGKTSFIPGGWSIGIEWVFYLAFPLFLIFRANLRSMLALLVLSFLLNQLIVGALLSQGTMVEQWNNYTNFPTFIVYFVAGVATAMLYKRRQKPASPLISRLVPLMALALIFCYPSATPEAYLQGWQMGLFVLAGMAGIYCAALVKPLAIERKLYHFLGDISYSTYLLNFFVYQLVDTLLRHIYPGHVCVVITLSCVLTILLAALSYRFYEMPMRRWINAKLA